MEASCLLACVVCTCMISGEHFEFLSLYAVPSMSAFMDVTWDLLFVTNAAETNTIGSLRHAAHGLFCFSLAVWWWWGWYGAVESNGWVYGIVDCALGEVANDRGEWNRRWATRTFFIWLMHCSSQHFDLVELQLAIVIRGPGYWVTSFDRDSELKEVSLYRSKF